MMVLPDELESSFTEELSRIEGEKRMPYITGIERRAIQRGSLQTARESVIEVLETRFEGVPQALRDRLNQIDDLARLKHLLKQAITIASVEELEQVMEQGEAIIAPPTADDLQTGNQFLTSKETEQARAEAEQARRDAIPRLLRLGLSLEQVAGTLSLSVDEARQFVQE